MRLVAPTLAVHVPPGQEVTVTANSGGFIRANGIDIHYIQDGEGMPLLLRHRVLD